MAEQIDQAEDWKIQSTDLWEYTEDLSSKLCKAIRFLREGSSKRDGEIMHLKAQNDSLRYQLNPGNKNKDHHPITSTAAIECEAPEEYAVDALPMKSLEEADIAQDETSATRKVEISLKSLVSSLKGQLEKLQNLLPRMSFEEQQKSELSKTDLAKLRSDYKELQNRLKTSESKAEELFSETCQAEVQLEELEAEVSRLKGQIRARDVVIKDLEKGIIKCQMDCDEKHAQILHLQETHNQLMKSVVSDEIKFLMADEMQCAICTDFLKNAFTLGCSHTFCDKCLKGLTDKLCPLCRQIISMTVATPMIDSLLQKIFDSHPDLAVG